MVPGFLCPGLNNETKVITQITDVTGCSDEECWSLLKGGCKNSLETLYFRFYDKLYDYAVSFCGNPEMTEDQIQSLFLKIWERRDSLPYVEYVKTYLWTSLRRRLIDEKRRQLRVEANTDLLQINDFRMVSSPEEIQLLEEHNHEVSYKLYHAVQRLQPREKEILYLKFFEGMSYQEIEKITSLSYQSVRNYTYEAVKTLRQVLGKPSEHSIEASKMTILKIVSLFSVIFV